MDPWVTDSLGSSYPSMLSWVKHAGWTIPSRGGEVKEIGDFSLHLRQPRYCVVSRRGFSHDFMHLEIDMLLAGVYDPELTQRMSPVAAGLTTPLTAYGPRVREQIPLVIAELQKDPYSRRAVVYVGRHDDLRGVVEAPDERAGEMPCTCLWQFLIRENRLHMIVYMRSWDAVWGLSYDVPCFVAIQIALARALRRSLGEYHHHAGSFHIYERHFDLVANEKSQTLMVDIGETWDDTSAMAMQRLAERRA